MFGRARRPSGVSPPSAIPHRAQPMPRRTPAVRVPNKRPSRLGLGQPALALCTAVPGGLVAHLPHPGFLLLDRIPVGSLGLGERALLGSQLRPGPPAVQRAQPAMPAARALAGTRIARQLLRVGVLQVGTSVADGTPPFDRASAARYCRSNRSSRHHGRRCTPARTRVLLANPERRRRPSAGSRAVRTRSCNRCYRAREPVRSPTGSSGSP